MLVTLTENLILNKLEEIIDDLQAKDVRCWFAPEDMKIGDKIRPRLDTAFE